LSPASITTSRIGSASSAKRDTKPELLLRRALWSAGLRYRVAVDSLPGRPDVVIPAARLVVFCDGDFWHGRNLERRIEKLAAGHNAPYWISKIKSNVERDRRIETLLVDSGWDFLRFWESDVCANPKSIAKAVLKAVRTKRKGRSAKRRTQVEGRLD
jgi:DNA mismatch endonuclease, patch repair protein